MQANEPWRRGRQDEKKIVVIGFRFALGLIFEVDREEAFGKMTEALDKVAAANESLSALDKEKTEFMGIAAHDLRNPLTIIISYARNPVPNETLTQLPGVIFEHSVSGGLVIAGIVTGCNGACPRPSAFRRACCSPANSRAPHSP